MSGHRHDVGLRGARYENFAQSILSHLASLVKVSGESDFGIDFYCQPLIPSGEATKTVAEMCALQIKGGNATLKYGGLKDGQWQEQDFIWLKTLTTPLYLARVEKGYTTVELFSLRRLWLLFWNMGIQNHPFRVTLVTQPKNEKPYNLPDLKNTGKPVPKGKGHGDGNDWTIDVGSPFLSLSQAMLNDENLKAQAIQTWRQWIAIDYLNLMRFHQFVPYFFEPFAWITNSPQHPMKQWLFWNKAEGVNIPQLAQNAAPVMISLGVHLQCQNNPDAFLLIPLLEWLQKNGWLDDFGKGLLNNLRTAQDEGANPAAIL